MKLLKNLFSSTSKTPSEDRAVYSNCSELSIKVFYDIVNKGNLQLLVISGDYSDIELNEVWENIYDEYCTLVDDGKTKQQLMTRARVNAMSNKLHYCNEILKLMSRGNTTEKTQERCFEVLRKYGYILDRKKELSNELESLARRLRQLQSQIKIKMSEIDDNGKKLEVKLMKSVVTLERILKREIDIDKTTVEKWIYINKEAKELADVK